MNREQLIAQARDAARQDYAEKTAMAMPEFAKKGYNAAKGYAKAAWDKPGNMVKKHEVNRAGSRLLSEAGVPKETIKRLRSGKTPAPLSVVQAAQKEGQKSFAYRNANAIGRTAAGAAVAGAGAGGYAGYKAYKNRQNEKSASYDPGLAAEVFRDEIYMQNYNLAYQEGLQGLKQQLQ